MTKPDGLNVSARLVERLVNHCLSAGLEAEDVALALMGAGSQMLVEQWGAPRVLAACDTLVDSVAAASMGAKH